MTENESNTESQTHWVVELETDPETGDLVMPLPVELLSQQGWQIGDTLVWDIDTETQELTLRKATHEDHQHKP